MKIPTKSHPFQHKQVLKLTLLLLIVLATRLPFLGNGYGTDPDATRVVEAARHISASDEYRVSRFPGYPIHEYIVALTPAKNSPFVANSISAIFSCIAVLFFALICIHYRIREWFILSMAFALTPSIYISSTITMDYIIALAFILAATYSNLNQKSALAGLLLGLAVGSRITSGAMLLPLAILIPHRFASRRWLVALIEMSVATAIVSIFTYLPVFSSYALGFFQFYDLQYPSIHIVLGRMVFRVWGVLGSVAILGFVSYLVLRPKNLKAAMKDVSERRALLAAGCVAILYLIAFLRLPHDGYYLIPLVPFVLLTSGLLLKKYCLYVFSVLLIISPYLLSIDQDTLHLRGDILIDTHKRIGMEK